MKSKEGFLLTLRGTSPPRIPWMTYRSPRSLKAPLSVTSIARSRYAEMTSSPFGLGIDVVGVSFYFVYCAIWLLRVFFSLRNASYCGRRRQVHERKKRVVVFSDHVFLRACCFCSKLFSNVFDHLKATQLRPLPKSRFNGKA